MRVLHVINNLPVGGAERFLVQLAPAQAQLGCDVSIVALVEPNPLADDLADVPFVSLGRTRLNDPRLTLDLTKTMRRLKPDVVHTHLFYADTFGRVAARAARVPAIVSTEHSTEQGDLSRRRLAGMRWTTPLAHRVVAVSSAVRDAVAQRLGLDPASVRVIPNGIDITSCDAAQPLPRHTLGVGDDDLLVGCVGRIVQSKGYAALVDAVAQLGDAAVHVLFVGDGPERAAMERHTRSKDLQERVHWLGFRSDVPRVLKTLDVFAMPSFWEGHSVALLEAMAAGCACLVSDIPEILETVAEAAYAVRAGDAASIAAGLRVLRADAAVRARLGSAARERAPQFSIESAAEKYVALYNEVLSARQHGQRSGA